MHKRKNLHLQQGSIQTSLSDYVAPPTCPCCNTDMCEGKQDEILFLCNTCYGTMASNAWIENNLKPGIIKRLQLPIEEPTNATFSCPICSGKMRTFHTAIPMNTTTDSKIQIDRCDRCKAIWFDNKELNQVLPDDINSFDIPFSDNKGIFSKIFSGEFWFKILK
ncbi:MAG: hypothetical protein CMA58_03060 [Euryarchaeota archaeon]|nr:hypothetical protein [Euryarchaeota archaeon]